MMENFNFVKCPECGEEWTNLTDDGICYDCRERKRRERVLRERKSLEASKPSLAKKVKSFVEQSLPVGDRDDYYDNF